MFVLTLDHSLIISWQGARIYKKEEKDKDWKILNIEKQPFRQKKGCSAMHICSKLSQINFVSFCLGEGGTICHHYSCRHSCFKKEKGQKRTKKNNLHVNTID